MARFLWVELMDDGEVDLHRRAKAAAAAQGTHLRQWILRALEAQLAQPVAVATPASTPTADTSA